MRVSTILLLIMTFLFSNCNQTQKEQNKQIQEKEDVTLNLKNASIDTLKLAVKHNVYVPIYSEIYVINAQTKCLLTATLSIRNTSMVDTMYLTHVDYYDSKGKLKQKYLGHPVFLTPLESIEYVVEYTEKEGGSGANFIVQWGASKNNLKPIVQAVMIGSTASQQGISFLTEGVEIE